MNISNTKDSMERLGMVRQGDFINLCAHLEILPINIGDEKFYDIELLEKRLAESNDMNNITPDSKTFNSKAEIYHLKTQIYQKLYKHKNKLIEMKKHLDDIDISMETYVNPRFKNIDKLVEDLGNKNLSASFILDWVIAVKGWNIYGEIDALVGEYIVGGDFEQIVEIDNKKFNLIVREGIAKKIVKI